MSSGDKKHGLRHIISFLRSPIETSLKTATVDYFVARGRTDRITERSTHRQEMAASIGRESCTAGCFNVRGRDPEGQPQHLGKK